MFERSTLNNSGIISTGDHAINTISSSSIHVDAVDWIALEKELEDLRQKSNLCSLKEFADEAMIHTKSKNYDGLIKSLQRIGKVGRELIIQSSAALLAEIIKKSIGL